MPRLPQPPITVPVRTLSLDGATHRVAPVLWSPVTGWMASDQTYLYESGAIVRDSEEEEEERVVAVLVRRDRRDRRTGSGREAEVVSAYDANDKPGLEVVSAGSIRMVPVSWIRWVSPEGQDLGSVVIDLPDSARLVGEAIGRSIATHCVGLYESGDSSDLDWPDLSAEDTDQVPLYLRDDLAWDSAAGEWVYAAGEARLMAAVTAAAKAAYDSAVHEHLAAKRVYSWYCKDDNATETVAASSLADAVAQAREIVEDGAWGDHGAYLSVEVYERNGLGELIDQESITVVIPPDHAALIREAAREVGHSGHCGTDPDVHEWTSEGEGGCEDNPGVWSIGGTTIAISDHCARCGLHRTTTTRWAQRNPGEPDGVEYEFR